MRNTCTRFAQDCTYFSNAQYVCKISAILYLFLQCAKYVQDLQDSTYFSNVQYMCKVCSRLIVLISSMQNICTRFAKYCIYFSNAQHMSKISARLYLFLQCTIYAQNFSKIVVISPMCNTCARFPQDRLYLFPQCTIYAQDLHKIVLISPMRNICARFAQDPTYFSNVQYIHKICTR